MLTKLLRDRCLTLYRRWMSRSGEARPTETAGRKIYSGAGDDVIQCAPFLGDRRFLLPLLKLADDSETQIRSYWRNGEFLVALRNGQVLGQALIVRRGDKVFELKSIAVAEGCQRLGIGRQLLNAVIDYAHGHKASTLTVSTSVADPEALGFYLRHGFRASAILRDAFTADRGYPAQTDRQLPLNDAIELELALSRSSDLS
ncbi:GNAT family N-acetyltransferase [Sphingomonas alba]|uniref:GNAT family N-acetyltransferase n=1 Tax=Sphingomonas alba TaxID=2908208 RepID=A0ABT0RK71_9SPHN|nr:GNAT family N-acetyltransferase [Sphingomonas alba]MCL6683034.1 GNAT family N-acetyltransferase [Sphingomonas alba]